MNVREMLQRASGLDLPQQAVDRALRQRMASRGAADADQYLRELDPAELAELIELVVVPESWMFRDAGAFAAAAAFVRHRLAAHPQRVVRILSIPCAGGEEPYSMAMALADAGVAPASLRIEGIDLSALAIERARAGRYTRNAFRGADLAFRDRHFSRVGDEYQISDALRSQVAFAQANLFDFDGAAAGRYDVVFCRNLLIYFDEATTAAAVAVVRTLLADHGMLFAGYAEVPAFCRNGFTPLRVPGAFALRKSAAAAPALAKSRVPERRHASASAPPARPAPPLTVAGADALAEARRLADNGHYDAAAAACRALLAADPGSADAYYLLGVVSECRGQRGAAADHWRRCVYLQPQYYDALCQLALLADQDGDERHAAALRQRAARVYDRRESAA